MKILDDAISKLQRMEASYSDIFPYQVRTPSLEKILFSFLQRETYLYLFILSFQSLSSASEDFKTIDAASELNEKVVKAVSTTLDEIAVVSQDIHSLETFIHLHFPPMEDGGNIGVSIQLAFLKQLSDLQSSISSKIEELSAYSEKRADALEKLKLPSTSLSVTKSNSQSDTDGKKEVKSSETTEEKKTSNDSTGPAFQTRVAALIATDTLYYSKAQRSFQSVMTLYMALLDFMDKNREKLEKPKGSGGSHSGYHSMY